VKIEDEGETLILAIYATSFKLRSKAITLVSMHNIESELAEQEMQAWQKLIRVLTHEIMNSVTPIASLASTDNTLIEKSATRTDDDYAQFSLESAEDIRDAVATIEKRSRGLLHFTEAYRNLTRIPKPKFSIFSVGECLDRTCQLLKGQLQKKGIELTTRVEPESLELTADRELIEQVLINLILNAVQALNGTEKDGDRRIALSSYLDDRGRTVIAVTDNGPGIDKEVMEKIFTPFYTTKKEGSGIGLSLSREIMRLHKGSISVQSVPDEETTFKLRF
jgi:signal transduction histidine kinase